MFPIDPMFYDPRLDPKDIPPVKPINFRKHFKRRGAAYVLMVLFLGSWLGQAILMVGNPDENFWAATFENWQSEWLQLLVQAVMLLGMKHVLFRADSENMERLEAKVDLLLEKFGEDSRP